MAEPFYYLSAEDVVPRDAVHVIVGGSFRVVPPSTFRGYQNLARVELQEGVQEIGARAFEDCPNLERVDFPSSLRTIGDWAFSVCPIPCQSRISEVVLQEGLEEIGTGAFSGCAALERVDCPSSLRTITDQAFSYCPQLSEVVLREGLLRIEAAFLGCWGLRRIAVPSSVVKIADYAFQGCALERIAVPSSVAEIGERASADCYNLEAATLAEGVVMVAKGAFFNCPRLERIAISSMAIVVEAGEDGNGRVAAVTGGIQRDPANRSHRLILSSPHLALMGPEELRSLTDANDRVANSTQLDPPNRRHALWRGRAGPHERDVSGRIRDGFTDHLSTWYRWYKREAATVLELGLWKIELGRAATGGETAGADAPTREDCRRTCGAVPIVGLVLSSLAGPHRRVDQSENEGSIQR